jgi:hypothetical protein
MEWAFGSGCWPRTGSLPPDGFGGAAVASPCHPATGLGPFGLLIPQRPLVLPLPPRRKRPRFHRRAISVLDRSGSYRPERPMVRVEARERAVIARGSI